MNGKIKLLIVTRLLDKGGMEEVILTYVKYLPKTTYDLVVACIVPGVAAYEIADVPGVRLVEYSAESLLGRLLRLWKLAREFKPHIVHNHFCWYGLMVGLLVGARRVETIHNTYHWLSRRELTAYGLYTRLADRIIAVSEVVARFTSENIPFVRSKSITVIHNGVDANRFSNVERDSNLRASLGIKSTDIVLGFVGRLEVQKGLEYLLAALEMLRPELPQVVCVIVGEGSQMQSLKERCLRSGLTNVVFTGFTRDTTPYYWLFDFFVLPSLFEGMPMSLIEAMAASRPVIASRVGGVAEAVEDGVSGLLVEPQNIGELVENIRYLATNPARREEIGRHAGRRVRQKFSAEAMVAKTQELYREVLGIA
jgi:glycosyltransferase involved in cell wall biosynthesis